MRKVIVACILMLALAGCGAATKENATVVDVTSSSAAKEDEDMSRTKVYYCKVTNVDGETISMENDGITYKMPVKGNEWVSEGDKLLLECREEDLKEEEENTYIVTKGLLSELEKNEKSN